jgi:hypothetical protein
MLWEFIDNKFLMRHLGLRAFKHWMQAFKTVLDRLQLPPDPVFCLEQYARKPWRLPQLIFLTAPRGRYIGADILLRAIYITPNWQTQVYMSVWGGRCMGVCVCGSSALYTIRNTLRFSANTFSCVESFVLIFPKIIRALPFYHPWLFK